MKKAGIIFLLMVGMIGCRKDSNIKPLINQGKWQISYYFDHGKNETAHFSGYIFEFHSWGTVTASNNGNFTNGTWSMENDDGYQMLELHFVPEPLNDLNDDWHITDQSNCLIMLEDVSGGGGAEYLHFRKL